ncbi:MAG TPA: glycogen synthase GlgA [Desulfomonilaceae bacterium]|nr:glycogen synthase GlgA [Desulfomonilaceae bacterium]
MRVLMITSEATPFAQTGGLGEVLSALPAELAALGLQVDVLMPKYRGIVPEKYGIKETNLSIELTLNAKRVSAKIWQLQERPDLRYLFLECDDYYDREYLYGSPEKDYEDNAERFVFLSRAAIEMSIFSNTRYDVFHSHDWQAALTPVYLRTLYAGVSRLEESSSVMTIHNLGYQGIFWHLDMPLVGVGWEFFTPKHMEFHGRLNFLKSGIVFADAVNTVSPGYRNEILTPEFGFGLEGVLQEKHERLSGILNGVDYKIWNPATDSFIAANYHPEDLAGKAMCKADLQKVAGLRVRPGIPVITVVSRLSNQKGVDMLLGAIPSLMKQDLHLVLLGTGEARYQAAFKEIASRYPGKIGIFLKYDYALAHKIFAGGDMILVPSRYEPCGVNQLYALKYGSVPIVRATGGLQDTVEEFDPQREAGTGFKFITPEPSELESTLVKALKVFREDPASWHRLMLRGMNKDYSWNRSAAEYARLYESAIRDRHDSLTRA